MLELQTNRWTPSVLQPEPSYQNSLKHVYKPLLLLTWAWTGLTYLNLSVVANTKPASRARRWVRASSGSSPNSSATGERARRPFVPQSPLFVNFKERKIQMSGNNIRTLKTWPYDHTEMPLHSCHSFTNVQNVL